MFRSPLRLSPTQDIMSAFLPLAPLPFNRPVGVNFTSRTPPLLPKRRHPVVAVLSDDDFSALNISYDDMVSDETHVVLDSEQISALLERMGKTATDKLDKDSLDSDFLIFAENALNEIDKTEPESHELRDDEKRDAPATDPCCADMQYFTDENLVFMPSWARDAYLDGTHAELSAASKVLASKLRLHDIIARQKPEAGGGDVFSGADITDCTVSDVADDYAVPVEFIVDAMLSFGVKLPIHSTNSIRNCMTSDEIERLLHLITSFDAVDLSDRYSDRSLREVAEDYNLDIRDVVAVCENEGLYLCAGERTRLSVAHEDRVLEIMLKGAPFGQPYPSLLDGLE